MSKRTSLLFGITMITLALLGLGGNLLQQPSSTGLDHGIDYWPLLVIGAGLLFCLPPLVFPHVKGLGGLFIPGLPVLATGAILYACAITGRWNLWQFLWPIEIISLAVGFILAAQFLNVIWLWIPASIVGINGALLLLSALTGLWEMWAVLWTIQFLAVGLPLLVIGFIRRTEDLKLAGIILCITFSISFTLMSTVTATLSRLFGILGAVTILVLGIFLIVNALFCKSEKE